MHSCGGCDSVCKLGYLNTANVCHMICCNCTATIGVFGWRFASFSLMPYTTNVFIQDERLPTAYHSPNIRSVWWQEAVDKLPFGVSGSFGLSKIALRQVATAARGQDVRGWEMRVAVIVTHSFWQRDTFFPPLDLILKCRQIQDWPNRFARFWGRKLDLSRCISITDS